MNILCTCHLSGGEGDSRANECAVFLTYPLSLLLKCLWKCQGFDMPRQTWQCNVITD